THEGTYYKWVERAWRGGLRVTVNLLVQNEVLCMIYPNLGDPPATLAKNCNDMATIKEQAEQTRQLQDYIDAQWGGPGKGWYRIVESPAEARKVINEGKLAVILGTESSDVFNCSKLNSESELTGKAGLNRSEEHTSELQSRFDLVCRLLLEKKKQSEKRQSP